MSEPVERQRHDQKVRACLSPLRGSLALREWSRGQREAPKARPEGSQGPARSAPPLDRQKNNFRPDGPTENGGAPVCRPSGAVTLFGGDPGAACSLRFALAPGYLLAAPSALRYPLAAPSALRYLLAAPSALRHLLAAPSALPQHS
jgi:hypothetical protein